MSNGGFSLSKLYQDSKLVLFQPKSYFNSMETTGGIGEPVLKAIIYGAVAGVLILIWSLLNITGITGGIFSGAVGVAGFFGTLIGAVIGVFLGGLIILVISSICNGNSDYEPNMRVAAAIMVLLPVNAFLGFFDGISYALGAIVSLAVNLYGLYLLYLAVTLTLKGNARPAKAISYILGAIVVLFMIIGLVSRNAVKKHTGLNQEKAQEMIEKYQQQAEEAAKKME